MYTIHAPDNQRPYGSAAARFARIEAAPDRVPEPVPADAIVADVEPLDTQETISDTVTETVREDADARVSDEGRPGDADEGTVPALTGWQAMGWLWSGRLLILVCVLTGLVGAFAVSRVLPPRYTSYADVIIAPPSAPVTPDGFAAMPAQRDTQIMEFDSRLRMLTSTNVLERTVDALSLDEDPEFTGSSGFPLPLLGPGPEARADAARLSAIRALYERVWAYREGQTYVATLEVHSQDPEKSVRIANGLLAAFQEEIWASERATATQAVEALSARLGILRERVAEAEAAVEAFRRENGLQGVYEGQLLTSRSLDQVNTQINDARAALIAAESRHAELVAARGSALAQSGVWDSDVIAGLRADYNMLRRELSAQSAIYGALHPNILTLQPQVAALEGAINEEVDRIIETAAANVEQARAVVDRLVDRSDTTRATLSVDESALITLRELQREADAQVAIYEAYLLHMGELSQQSQVEVTTVRVISPPLPAVSRSWPPRLVVWLALGGIAGLALGTALAFVFGAGRTYLPVLRRRVAASADAR